MYTGIHPIRQDVPCSCSGIARAGVSLPRAFTPIARATTCSNGSSTELIALTNKVRAKEPLAATAAAATAVAAAATPEVNTPPRTATKRRITRVSTHPVTTSPDTGRAPAASISAAAIATTMSAHAAGVPGVAPATAVAIPAAGRAAAARQAAAYGTAAVEVVTEVQPDVATSARRVSRLTVEAKAGRHDGRKGSGYQRYLQDNWWRVKKQLPDAEPKEVMTLLGKTWSGLDAETKEHYNKLGSTTVALVPSPRRRSACNPFFVYMKQQLPRLQMLHPRSRIPDLVKMLGKDWRQLTSTQKQQYRNLSVAPQLEGGAAAELGSTV